MPVCNHWLHSFFAAQIADIFAGLAVRFGSACPPLAEGLCLVLYTIPSGTSGCTDPLESAAYPWSGH
ncbi:hypothetical protein D3C81_1869890 [compost metagenome]